MAIEEVRTFKNIQDEIIALGKIKDTTANRAEIKRRINQSQLRLASKKTYRWSGKTRPLKLQARYNTGTVTTTQNGYSLTGASTVWTAFDHRFCKIKVGSVQNPFRVVRVASNTSLTMDAPYLPAGAASVSYTIFKDEYPLFPDFQAIRKLHIPGSLYRLTPSTPEELEYLRHSSPFRTGLPRKYIVDGLGFYKAKTWADWLPNTDFFEPDPDAGPPGNPILHVWPGIFTENRMAQVRYTIVPPQMGVDADEPIIPLESRGVLVLDVLLTHYIQQRDTEMYRNLKREFEEYEAEMGSDLETTDDELVMVVDRQMNRRMTEKAWSDDELLED